MAELIDYFDEITGLTVIKRTTNWVLSTIAIMTINNKIAGGVFPVEIAISIELFASQLLYKGIIVSSEIKFKWRIYTI
jgi:hypothetical protein